MSLAQNPLSPEEREQRSRVERLEREQLAWTNILRLRGKIKDTAKEQKAFDEAISKLQGQQAQEATRYQGKLNVIKTLERNLIDAKKRGNEQVAKQAKKMLEQQQAQLKDLTKTEGGALAARRAQAEATRKALTAERDLIKDINKQRGITGRIADLFRSKEARQRQIDIARAQSGGGANVGGGGGGGSVTGAAAAGAAAGGPYGALAAGLAAFVQGIKNTVSQIGKVILTSLAGPLQQISGLVSGGIGGGYGVGGGAISGGGATSILGGFQDIASKIPFIGGLLGGLIGIFKGIVDLVLGLDQGITNFARNLGISKDQAKVIKEDFRAIAKASDNIVVNETRLMESQVELTRALGVRNQFAKDALENNIKLKEIAGLELETRKAIVQTSVIQGRNATQLTKNVLAQSKAFEFQTGIAFEYRQVLGEASKQAGVLGLTFTKYPEKLTKALMTTKAMGIELKQLDGIASSFLDFESSISKEIEAQILTGRELNLTKAREAALNNDLVTVAKEITSQVGSTDEYLRMNRIQQEAIAESVGMTRDGLADVLKQQDYYRKLGASNLEQAQKELKVLKEKGLTQAEISKRIGEDAYNYITQTSTAERLTELMNRIKTVFIEFVEKSGILDFITNPDKIQGFVTGLINKLAGAVNMVGEIVAGIVELVADVTGFFSEDRATRLRGLASSVRSGAAGFAGGITAATSAMGGVAAPSVGSVLEQGARGATTAPAAVYGPVPAPAAGNQTTTVYMVVDGEVIAKQVVGKVPSMFQTNLK